MLVQPHQHSKRPGRHPVEDEGVAGTIAIEDLVRLQVFIVLYALIALVASLWVLPGLIATLTPLRFADISRALRTPLVTAFATGSGLIVIPMLIEKCKDLITEAQIIEHDRQEYADSLVEISIPTVYPFPDRKSTRLNSSH